MSFTLWNQDYTNVPTLEMTILDGITPSCLLYNPWTENSEMVTGVGGFPLYIKGVDYTVDYLNGCLARTPASSIPSGFMIDVNYSYVDPGSQMWSETKNVAVSDGIYNVSLGETNPLSYMLLTGSTAYMEVAVEGETMSPRVKLASVPYALKSHMSAQAGWASAAYNASVLEGHPASDFALADHTHPAGDHTHDAADIISGTLGADYYSAVTDLVSEGYLDNDADADLLTRLQADGRFINEGQLDSITGNMVNFNFAGSLTEAGPAADLACTMCVAAGEMADGAALAEIADDDGAGSGLDADLLDGQHGSYYRDASNLNAGTLANNYFSAYSDLTAEGYLNNDSNTDLLTRLQSDGRFVNTTGDDAMAGNLTVGGDLTVSGGNIGIRRAADPANTYGIMYSSTTLPSTGILMYAQQCGVDVATGDEMDDHYNLGGYFYTKSSGPVRGLYAQSNGYGDYSSEGVLGAGHHWGEGDAYGLTGNAYVSGSTADAYGVTGEADNAGNGNSYGGYFISSDSAPGPNYGVYALGDDEAGRFANGLDPENNYVVLADGVYGVRAIAGDSTQTVYVTGGDFKSYSRDGSSRGIKADSQSDGMSTAVEGYAHSYGGNNHYVRGGVFDAEGDYGVNYGVYSSSSGLAGSENYGVYTYAAGAGTNYGLYVSGGTKNWVNPDPEDPGKSIVYATLEGGENGTYWRGTARLDNGRAEVVLPDHFRKVTSPDYPVTVTVTPRGQCNGLMLAETTNAKIVVEELMNGKSGVEFDFIIMGKRLGYEEFNPEIANRDYVPFNGHQVAMDPAVTTTQEFYDNQSPGLKKIFKQNGTLDGNGKVNEKLFKEKNWKIVKEKSEK